MNFHSKASPPSRTSVKLKKLAISAGVALALSSGMLSAHASGAGTTNNTYDLGSLTTANSSTPATLPLAGAFGDTFTFNLATGTLDVVGITSYWDKIETPVVDLTLTDSTSSTSQSVVATATYDKNNRTARYNYTFTGLTALDNYSLVVSGPEATHLGSTYTLQMVASVPEPESYAMLLAGLGLVGAMVRRRKSTVKGS